MQVRSENDDFILGVAKATNALISEQLDEGINLSLEVLGKYLNVGSSCVYVNEQQPDGTLTTSVKYFWAMEVDEERRAHNQNVPFSKLGNALEQLESGDYFEFRYSDSPAPLKAHMEADGTRSAIFFPVSVEGSLWGVVGLVDFVQERIWTDPERSLLQSFANSIGGAVCRHLLEHDLEEQVEKRTRELSESRQRFKLVVEGSQDGIWDWQPHLKTTYWSPRLFEQLGYAPNEIAPPEDHFFDWIHPEDRDRIQLALKLHLEDRKPYEEEFRIRGKSGAYRWFRSTGQAEWDEEGTAIRMVGSHEDIHERKLKDELLKRSEQRFKALIIHDPNAVFLVNACGEIDLFSDRALALFGYSQEELVGKPIHELLPPQDRMKHKSHFEVFMQDPKTRMMGQGMDLKGLRKDGSLFWVEVGLSPVSIEEEHFVLAVVTDISKRRSAELLLEESHRRMENLVNNLPGMVYRCRNEENWPMEYISRACESITGYVQADFYGGNDAKMPFGHLIHEDDKEDVWELVQQGVKANRSFRVIYRIKDQEGHEKWVWEQGNGVWDDEGHLLGLEGCIFDISPVVKNQEAVNSAIYEAEDSERRRIAGEIHDSLQQTLSVSALNLQYLEQDIMALDEECQRRYFNTRDYLEKGIRESREIAHRLMPKAIHEVGLDRALKDIVNRMRSDTAVDCTYYSNLKGRVPARMEVGLYRVAQEAMNNVLKYAQATKVAVQLVMHGGELQLMIEDNGVGFDKNSIDLYETGFGLTGMKNRIATLGGRLLIDTRPGHGTAVVARLPVTLDDGSD